MDRISAPKADALPGCATPRHAVSLGKASGERNPEGGIRGNDRQNEAGTGGKTPGLSPNQIAPAGDGRRGQEYRVTRLVEDRPLSGMWHCGPNAAWIEVTHLPTMISARAFDDQHHRAKSAAMACCEMMVEQSRLLKCQFPERLIDPLAAEALAMLEALRNMSAAIFQATDLFEPLDGHNRECPCDSCVAYYGLIDSRAKGRAILARIDGGQ